MRVGLPRGIWPRTLPDQSEPSDLGKSSKSLILLTFYKHFRLTPICLSALLTHGNANLTIVKPPILISQHLWFLCRFQTKHCFTIVKQSCWIWRRLWFLCTVYDMHRFINVKPSSCCLALPVAPMCESHNALFYNCEDYVFAWRRLCLLDSRMFRRNVSPSSPQVLQR